jgi:two-component system, chemotaxis family, chemotaxis protein CheY
MKRVVIADDSQTARMLIRRCLEIVGLGDAQFVEVTNGREALLQVKEAETDLLVTDLNMPAMDGELLLRWIKSSPRLCHLPVLVITSAGNAAKESELLKFGACGVLRKPVSPAALSQKLSALLAQWRTK